MESKEKHEEGAVVVRAIIAKDGHVRDTQAVDSPSDLLAKPAADAVSTYVYRPYLVDGKSAEVNTTININYTLSH